MEKRVVIAMVLGLALLGLNLWVQEKFFPQPPPAQKSPSQTAAPSAPTPPAPVAQAPAPPPAAAPMARKPAAAPPRPEAPRPPQRLAAVDTPLYRAVVSSEGGKLQELVLKYRGEKPMVLLGELGPGGLVTGAPGQAEPVPLAISSQALQLGPDRPTGELVLTGEVDGLRVRETLAFRADSYTIETKLRVENTSAEPKQAALAFPWTTRQEWDASTAKFQGQHPTTIAMSAGSDLRHTDDLTHPGWYYGCMSMFFGARKDAEQIEKGAAPGDWIALGSSWYATALIAKTQGFEIFTASDSKPADAKAKPATPLRTTVGLRAVPTLAPGAAWEGAFVVYAGPKEYDRLHAAGLEESINFGGFPLPRECGGLPMKWFAVPILSIMNWLYGYARNYGLAIILLTVLSKVLFYPLTVKSMRSMKAMQALGPQVNALKSKYKNEPQRLQKETMELYRKHGANPLGGCLPMLAQVPVFYALYLAVANSAELQNAAFLCFGRLFGVDLWICDLAAQDPTYVLPILMGISMFVQQKMTPTAGDPRQAKMMLIVMPAVFTLMFLNLPSGLVLYWTVSNALQILQQWYMDRGRVRAEREAKDAGRA